MFLIIFNIELTCCNVAYCACSMDQKHLFSPPKKPKSYIYILSKVYLFSISKTTCYKEWGKRGWIFGDKKKEIIKRTALFVTIHLRTSRIQKMQAIINHNVACQDLMWLRQSRELQRTIFWILEKKKRLKGKRIIKPNCITEQFY